MIERRDKEITDLSRRMSNAVLVGTVSAVDHEKYRYRVKAGDLETDWLPMASPRAGQTKTYSSLNEGEQVVLVSPSGDLAQAVIVGSVATDETQAADKGSIHRTVYPDGSVAEYDHEKKAYSLSVADGGSFTLAIGGGASIIANGGALKIKAPGGVDIDSPTLTNNGKNISHNHRHKDVEPGGGVSGIPV